MPVVQVIALVGVVCGVAGFLAGLLVGAVLVRRQISAKHRGKYPWR